MEFNLTIVSDLDSIYENARGIIWTIFFNRLFGPITPANDYFLEVPYPKVDHYPELDDAIDEKVGQMVKQISDSSVVGNAAVFKSAIALRFYEKSAQPSGGTWFPAYGGTTGVSGHYMDSEQPRLVNCWETWNLKINVINNKRYGSDVEGERYDIEAYREIFESNMLEICELVDSNKNHIPPIVSMDTSPFPYRIEHTSEDTREYVTTTDAGDVILSAGGTDNEPVYGEEILKNGYNLIKKLLGE